ncbi:MAG: hypothetical protein WC894_03270 [Patescibacteria group bacterium]
MSNSRSAHLRGSADSRMIELDYSVISQYADRQISTLEQSIYKVLITGEFIEVSSYQFPIRLHIQRSKIARDSSSDRLEEYQKVSNRKSFSTLRSLIFGNFSIFDKFITLTFKDTEKFDIRDLTYCNFRKERFVKKLKEIKPDLKYIIVPEYQKRGAVHYHILCNLQYIPKGLFKKYWIYGFSSIDAIKELDKSLFYLTKYISKNTYIAEFKGRRRFYASKNITRPISLYGEPARLIAYQLYFKKPICSYSSETEWLGSISYRGYRVPRGQFSIYYIPETSNEKFTIIDPTIKTLTLGL